MVRQYKHLSEEEQKHFVEHGWLKVPGAIKQEYIDAWMADLWVRLGWDPKDKSTWTEPYVKMPRHREAAVEDFCPDAWNKIVEIVGGEDVIDSVRDRFYGDQFHVNFGSADLVGTEWDPKKCRKFHTGGFRALFPCLKTHLRVFSTRQRLLQINEIVRRQFLDSGECALTIVCVFTDMDTQGGATTVCPEGIKQFCEILYEHPEGDDPPFDHFKLDLKITDQTKFEFLEAEAGDVVITHNLLPHAAGPNRRHYARVITNPHVTLNDHLHLYREDQDYTLAEQVILHHMGRPEGMPEFKITRERLNYYPRNGFYKRARVDEELDRMIADARRKGLPESSVGSIYQGTEEEIAQHEARNRYNLPWGPKGVSMIMDDSQIFSYKGVKVQ